MLQLKKQQGFTFVELLLAMALFSAVLVVLTSGIITLYRIYQSGVGIRNTQQAARLIAEDITRAGRENAVFVEDNSAVGAEIQVATSNVPLSSQAHDAVCFYNAKLQPGATRNNGIIFYTRKQAGVNDFNIYRDTIRNSDCKIVNADGNARQLNGPDVTILKFDVTHGPNGPAPLPDLTQKMASFDIVVAARTLSKAVDLEIIGGRPSCIFQSGSQYCSITNLSSGVGLRRVP